MIPASHNSMPLLMSRLENLLERVRLKVQHTRAPGSMVAIANCSGEVQSAHASLSRIPWDDVVVICIDHKLKDWQIPGPPTCEGEPFPRARVMEKNLYIVPTHAAYDLDLL